MKIKLNDLVQAQGALGALAAIKDLPAKRNFFVGGKIRKLREHLKQYDESRIATVEKYQILDAEGNPVPELDHTGERIGNKLREQSKFNAEIRDMLDAEIEVEDPVVGLSWIPEGRISAGDASLLWFFLVDDLPEEQIKNPPVKPVEAKK
jgi:hypothetical protein